MLVFVLVGPWAGAEHWLWALAMRWGIMTQTADVTTLALIQPLHGLTFALFHLGYMHHCRRLAKTRYQSHS